MDHMEHLLLPLFNLCVCMCISREGHVNLNQEPSTGPPQLVQDEANTDWLIKFDGRLQGHKSDLW